MIDVFLLAVLGGTAWMVSSEGAWGAATTLISVIFSGLLAMMFFEPLAIWLNSTVLSGPAWGSRADIISLGLIFGGGVTLMRIAGEKIQKTDLDIESKAYDVLRWVCGLGAGYVTAAIVLTTLHTAPLSREFGGFTPERGNMFDFAPDRQWLGYTQYASEHTLHAKNAFGQKRVFDGPEYALLPGQPAHRWSSFPIRYASRRGVAAGTAAPGRSGPPGATPAAPGEAPAAGGGEPAGSNLTF